MMIFVYFNSHEKDSVRMTYLEDSVSRLTSATASSLPHLSKHPECVQTQGIEEAFDWAEQTVHNTISGRCVMDTLKYWI